MPNEATMPARDSYSWLQPKVLVAAVACIVTVWPQAVVSQQCTQEGPCKCSSSVGTIDLSPITGSPAFKDFTDQVGTWKYSYSPCQPFSEGSGECQSVLVCQVNWDQSQTFPCGTVDSAVWGQNDKGNNIVTYTKTDKIGTVRTTIVTLNCDNTSSANSLVVQGEEPFKARTYTMTLTSRHCCFNSEPGSTGSKALSGGTIVLIAFVVLVFVYILVGVAVQKGVRKATGKEMIPNYTFWSSVPGLIKVSQSIDAILTFTIFCPWLMVSQVKLTPRPAKSLQRG